MLKIENDIATGWDAAIRGMRNPMNSWARSDSSINFDNNGGYELYIGPDDHRVMMLLAKEGSVDAKYRRMINVTLDITAPLYWWKEFDAYKIGTVANSCSTMHKIHAKEFTLDDFSCEHLLSSADLIDPEYRFDPQKDIALSAIDVDGNRCYFTPLKHLENTVQILNRYREKFIETKDKRYWWQLIQLLPSSYNQRRTVQVNYEVLAGIYPKRKDHKLDEWHTFCDWIKTLPYSEIITLEE